MSIRKTIICDGCEKHFLLDDDEEMPPYWFIAQIAVGNGEGFISAEEQESLSHFCSQTCLVEYCGSDRVRELAAMADIDYSNEPEPEPDNEAPEEDNHA